MTQIPYLGLIWPIRLFQDLLPLLRRSCRAKFPVLLIVGKREAEEGTVSFRRIGRKDSETLTLREAMVRLETEVLRSTPSSVSLPPVEGWNEDKAQLAEAAAG